MKLILASDNQHKLQEIQEILAHTGLEILSLNDYPDIPDPPETQDTFHGNAKQKATFVHSYTGGIVIADDSGLEVEALNGAPGIHSKRWTPEATAVANNVKLLRELKGETDRRAQFRCILAIYNGIETTFIDSTCTGEIAHQEKGTQGFGYDPLFLPDGFSGKSMAELSMEQKNQISHRGLAFRQLPGKLAERLNKN